jgi:hypothetical protein
LKDDETNNFQLLSYGHAEPPKPPASLIVRIICGFCALVVLAVFALVASFREGPVTIVMGLIITGPFVAMLSYRAITGRVLPGLSDRDWRDDS